MTNTIFGGRKTFAAQPSQKATPNFRVGNLTKCSPCLCLNPAYPHIHPVPCCARGPFFELPPLKASTLKYPSSFHPAHTHTYFLKGVDTKRHLSLSLSLTFTNMASPLLFHTKCTTERERLSRAVGRLILNTPKISFCPLCVVVTYTEGDPRLKRGEPTILTEGERERERSSPS